MTGTLDGRVALVTGASRGIGHAAALAMANAGAQIIAIARPKSVGALEELDDAISKATGKPATLVPLDLKDAKGIENLGAAIYERWGKLDILVGNAGQLGELAPVGHIDPKQWDKVLDINVSANWRLLRSMDPLLRLSDAGRAIFVTSGASYKTKPFWALYSASKAALDKLVEVYAEEMKDSKVKANLLDPGPIRTAMRALAFPGEDADSLATPQELAPLFVEMAAPGFTQTGARISFKEWRES